MFCLFSLPQLNTYIQDRVIFQRERATGLYSAFEYFISVTLCDVPLQFLITLLYTVRIERSEATIIANASSPRSSFGPRLVASLLVWSLSEDEQRFALLAK